MKTSERILEASLTLFNTQGERQVTTNHIAAHINMSPGNLYYHFRNKQEIILALFKRHEADLSSALTIPTDRPFTIADKAALLEQLFAAQWSYRFIYRERHYLAEDNSELAEENRRFFAENIQRTDILHQIMAESGLIIATKQEQHALSINAWIIMASWFSFSQAFLVPVGQVDLPQPLAKRGIYQILALEKPYMTPSARQELEAIEERYLADLDIGLI
jgi:AcrR family transcriptional regulator